MAVAQISPGSFGPPNEVPGRSEYEGGGKCPVEDSILREAEGKLVLDDSEGLLVGCIPVFLARNAGGLDVRLDEVGGWSLHTVGPGLCPTCDQARYTLIV
ncbi:hypothetical protein P8605_01060 [Streptomyces sp. T-3]|nr:hypothetical protein [Streptomyces sp. T-3]